MIDDILAAYDWFDHPEGPKFVETHRDAHRTSGHWLFLPGVFSAFHKVHNNEELWLIHVGRLLVHVLDPGGAHRVLQLGTDVARGERPVVSVPAGHWQASELPQGTPFAFGTNVCAPPFSFEEFTAEHREELLRDFPLHADLVMRLTRGTGGKARVGGERMADSEMSEGGGTVTDSCAELWAAFLASGSPAAASAVGAVYSSWQFGLGAEMADRLLALVLSGRKRATAGSLWSYEHEGEPVPRPGDFSVVTDGAGVGRCVIRTTSVQVVAFDDVDEAFAHDEGEGDLSLTYWRDGHWAFFTRELAEFGRAPEPDMPVVCERFELVWGEG